MINPIKRLLLLAVLLQLTTICKSQVILGYSGGYLPAYELNRDIYVYDAVNRAGLKKEMPALRLFSGPFIGYRLSSEKGFVEMVWNRKVATTTSQFDSAGIPFQRQMKFYSTTFNWGGGYTHGKFHVGASLDFGFTKAKGKRGATDGFKNLAWVKLATPPKFLRLVNRILPDANTIWVEYDLTSFLSLRLYAQVFYMKTDFSSEKSGTNVERWLFGEELNWNLGSSDRLNSYGFALYLAFGKK